MQDANLPRIKDGYEGVRRINHLLDMIKRGDLPRTPRDPGNLGNQVDKVTRALRRIRYRNGDGSRDCASLCRVKIVRHQVTAGREWRRRRSEVELEMAASV